MLGQHVFVRMVAVETQLVVCSKVSRAGICILAVSGGEIIGSANLPVCTLLSCVILSLLLQEAGRKFGCESPQSVFGTSQINRCWRSLHTRACVCDSFRDTGGCGV